ncbi:MAG TPA: pullulanase-type alpha-1,6-glucosidase [Burkholderiaceae bacterium]|nr:pullulanase-type alpha-1,6-glucosidase [Burkholderiaceae bacterium]
METIRARLGRLLRLAVLCFVIGGIFVMPAAQAQVPADTARIHYNRVASDYAGWVIYTWTGAANPSPSYPGNQGPSGSDSFGVYYDVPLAAGATLLNFILTNGASKNCPNDMALNLASGSEIWQRQDDCTIYFAPPQAASARIHYNRLAGDYAGWVIYTWNGALSPSPSYPGNQGPSGSDSFGVYYDVALVAGAPVLNFILTNGATKNCPNDMALNLASGSEIWQLQDDCTIYFSPPPLKVGDVTKARAYWLAPGTIAWPGADPADTYRFYFAADGGITTDQTDVVGGAFVPLSVDANGLSADLRARYPYIATATALALRQSDLASAPTWLQGQIVVARYHGGKLADATSLQIAGVLDALYTFKGRLGTVSGFGVRDWNADDGKLARPGGLQFRLWAPTAHYVNLVVYDSPSAPAGKTLPMRWSAATGVWSVEGDRSWINRKYYKYDLAVYVRSTGHVEVNSVTDPYSLGLSVDSQRSLVVDLDSPETKPSGWRDPDEDRPRRGGFGPLSVYELHVRDFSASDSSVPPAWRGKFLAFTDKHSRGMTHLRALADAGLTYVHLLPSFDFATVPENPADQQVPSVPAAAPDSSDQQAAVGVTRNKDAFNWGYDPWHYTVPEGSYATDANGLARIREFRAMVQGLHDAGLKVVMDVVYNHTTASGQDPKSVLDRIVPGYYHRLDASGNVLADSCCSDTASENAMFAKLMIDSTEVWTRAYGIDAFRFDLMSFHPKDLMVKLRDNLRRYNPDVYIYGEGWNFGAIANDARFVQASQLNMAGTGIGTFSDRLRDAVRGGGPFDGSTALVKNQGFINGLWYDNNAAADPQNASQRDGLAHLKDLIMLGMAGNLKDYMLVDKDGNLVAGSQVDYFGQPAAYTGRPDENIVYASAHDNQTLFDISQYKLPVTTSLADRVRAQTLGLAIIALSQGVSFFHAGDDLLRSKSFDNNSYDSGDWFNRLDFTYQSNNWAVGLPPAWSNDTNNWSVMAPFLRDPSLKPGFAEIDQARRNFADFLAIRAGTPLLNLGSAQEIYARLKFYNTGPTQNPALIVMAIAGDRGRALVVLVNADKVAASFTPQTGSRPDFAGTRTRLHAIQRRGADPVVKTSTFDPATGRFTVPARTAAVFEVRGSDDNDGQ